MDKGRMWKLALASLVVGLCAHGASAGEGDLFFWKDAKVEFGLVAPNDFWDKMHGDSPIVDMTENEDGSRGHWDLYRVRFNRNLMGKEDPVLAYGEVRSKADAGRDEMSGSGGKIKIGRELFKTTATMSADCSEDGSGCDRKLTIDGVSESGLHLRIVATGESDY